MLIVPKEVKLIQVFTFGYAAVHYILSVDTTESIDPKFTNGIHELVIKHQFYNRFYKTNIDAVYQDFARSMFAAGKLEFTIKLNNERHEFNDPFIHDLKLYLASRDVKYNDPVEEMDVNDEDSDQDLQTVIAA